MSSVEQLTAKLLPKGHLILMNGTLGDLLARAMTVTPELRVLQHSFLYWPGPVRRRANREKKAPAFQPDYPRIKLQRLTFTTYRLSVKSVQLKANEK